MKFLFGLEALGGGGGGQNYHEERLFSLLVRLAVLRLSEAFLQRPQVTRGLFNTVHLIVTPYVITISAADTFFLSIFQDCDFVDGEVNLCFLILVCKCE